MMEFVNDLFRYIGMIFVFVAIMGAIIKEP